MDAPFHIGISRCGDGDNVGHGKSGADTLDKLFTAAFGRVVGRIAAIPLILLFIASAFFILTDFVNMIHSFVFTIPDIGR